MVAMCRDEASDREKNHQDYNQEKLQEEQILKKLPKKVPRWPHLELADIGISYLHFASKD